jgi:uncharacterized membrane protein
VRGDNPNVARIREEIEIEAPLERVWQVVHEDLKNVPKWSRNIARVHMLNGDVPGRGSEIRYDVKLPGGRIVGLEFLQSTFNKPRRCAGRFINGPLRGTWSYSYREDDGVTRLVFEAEYQMAGMLRFIGGMFESQYAAGVRDNMQSLKQYIEAGKGPRTSATETKREPGRRASRPSTT